jgi:branched-chain amino acid transport system substrate-binding protein
VEVLFGWSGMRARAVGLAGAIVLIAVGCGGAKPEPVGIGILSDCYGAFSSDHELIVASAELPLIERGAILRGRDPSDGIEGASAAGRPVELLVGCVAGSGDVLPEARRLVEEDGADVVIGPLFPNHGPIVRDYARVRPETAFLIQPSGAPEVTLGQTLSNVFRFTADNAQSAAGLGSYAYHDLGWRTAATVADDTPYGWGTVAGFVAEFCALGGRVVDRRWTPPGAPTAGLATALPFVDGVYVGGTISPMIGFVRSYARTHSNLSRWLVADAVLLYDPQVVAAIPGLVASGAAPFEPTPAMQGYMETFDRAFPAIPAAFSLSPLAVPYRNGVEAVLIALERTQGETGEPLMEALARLKLDTPAGRIRLDTDGQAVAPNFLTRVATTRGAPPFTTLQVIPDVEQTFRGYFKPSDPPPSRTSPACKKGKPPPWARR